jgi:predicted Zn-dependent protease
MNPNQLPIFDRHTMIMGEGYRWLASFKFEKAAQHFEDAVHTSSGAESEPDEALQACNYWQPLIQQRRESPREQSLNELYQKFRLYDFGSASGLRQFKRALLEYITGRLLAADQFYINDEETVSDLLLELQRPDKAERVVEQRLEKQPRNDQLRYCLAQIQWQNNHKGEAKKHFARALLYDPCHIPFYRIKYKALNGLIDDVGAEMAPAFGWLRGILPLVQPPENIKMCSEMHQKGADSYQLLYLADRAAVKKNSEARLKYRKKLHNQAPELYEEYIALFNPNYS